MNMNLLCVSVFLLKIRIIFNMQLSTLINSVHNEAVSRKINAQSEISHENKSSERLNCDCTWEILSIEYYRGNEYLITLSEDISKNRSNIIQINITNKTGEHFSTWTIHIIKNLIMINTYKLLENKNYTLSITYKICGNCTATLEFTALEKVKVNIPFFVGIVSVVSLMIIAMCFYNIRSKCILRFIQELKRLPFLVNCTDKEFVDFETS